MTPPSLNPIRASVDRAWRFSTRRRATVADPDLRMAILQEMASIRRELIDLANTLKPALGPPDFMRRYTEQLKDRLARLEEELKESDSEAC